MAEQQGRERAPPAAPLLETFTASVADRCRCGTPLPAGRVVFRFDHAPELASTLVVGRSYCGVACARADVLEALAFFEQSRASTLFSDAAGVTTALRVLYLGVFATSFATPAGATRPATSADRTEAPGVVR